MRKRMDSAVAEVLLAGGAAVNVKNRDSFTPLHRAAQDGHSAVAKALIAGGAAADVKKSDGFTALHTAAYFGHTGRTRATVGRPVFWL